MVRQEKIKAGSEKRNRKLVAMSVITKNEVFVMCKWQLIWLRDESWNKGRSEQPALKLFSNIDGISREYVWDSLPFLVDLLL